MEGAKIHDERDRNRGLRGAVRTLGGAAYSSRAAPKVSTKGHTTGARAQALFPRASPALASAPLPTPEHPAWTSLSVAPPPPATSTEYRLWLLRIDADQTLAGRLRQLVREALLSGARPREDFEGLIVPVCIRVWNLLSRAGLPPPNNGEADYRHFEGEVAAALAAVLHRLPRSVPYDDPIWSQVWQQLSREREEGRARGLYFYSEAERQAYLERRAWRRMEDGQDP